MSSNVNAIARPPSTTCSDSVTPMGKVYFCPRSPGNQPSGWLIYRRDQTPADHWRSSMGNVVKYERTLFEPEHDLFRESYRGFLDRHVAPFHDQWEKDKIVDRGVWLEAGKQGFLGMAVPEEYGGGRNSRLCLHLGLAQG